MNFTKKMKHTVLSSAVILGMAAVPALAATNSQQRGQEAQQNEQAETQSQTSAGVIKNVQRSLKERGVYNGPINGQETAQTQAAISRFQEANGLAVTGNPDPHTLQALGISNAEAKGKAFRSEAEAQETAGTPSQLTVKAAQHALEQQGLYSGPVNGKMDVATRTAIKNFQATNDLPATGHLTPQTENALGIRGK